MVSLKEMAKGLNHFHKFIANMWNNFDINTQTNEVTQIIEKISNTGSLLFRKNLKVKTRYLYPEDIIKICEKLNSWIHILKFDIFFILI